MTTPSSEAVGTGLRPLRVLCWVTYPFDTSPGQRFRIEQWEPFLRDCAISLTYSPLVDGRVAEILSRKGAWSRKAASVVGAVARRVIEGLRVQGYDLVYIFREGALLGPAWAERALVARQVPFVFDFDDAVWMRYVSPANSYFSLLRCPGKTETLCRRAGHVLAGNRYLAEFAAHHSSDVTVVPTTIDITRHVPRSRSGEGPLVIGWTGSFSTGRYLEMVRPALESLAKRFEFRVVLVGAEGLHGGGFRVESRPWRSASEMQDLAEFDIGVMPLTDSPWERGKCGLKALQYMALGLPAVVSPVGVNRDIVTHDENGLLAASDAEWENGLARLLTDPSLRSRLGSNGRRCVEERFSAQMHAPRVADVFRRVSSTSGARGPAGAPPTADCSRGAADPSSSHPSQIR